MLKRSLAGVWLVAAALGSPNEAQITPTVSDIVYAPPEVVSIGGVPPHPVHKLNVWKPVTPEPPDGYPVVLFSPAGVFLDNPPLSILLERLFAEVPPWTTLPPLPPRSGCNTFLVEALDAGWVIVVAGSTGWNSKPVCGVSQDCNDCPDDPSSTVRLGVLGKAPAPRRSLRFRCLS